MSADYTTVGLIANAKRRAFIPAGSGLTSSDILQVLTEQLRNYIPAFLKSIREEYIIASLNITVTGAVVPVPPRAVGAALRGISWTRSDGSLRPLVRIEPERRSDFALVDSEPVGYVFRGNNVILVPAVTSGTVVVTYQQRPGQLVLPSACGVVYGYDDVFGLICDAFPASIIAGSVCDIVSASPNFKLLAMDVVVASVADAGGGQSLVVFTAELPTDIAAGDYVCLATETPIPQVPMEVHDLIAQAAAMEIAQATGSSRLQAIEKGLKDLREQLTVILTPRNDGSARVILNRSGLGRRGF